MRIGALEAGGTKMVCAIGNENGELEKRIEIPTETPEITVPKMLEFYRGEKVEAVGIGCFGPIDLKQDSPTFGYITSTPKKGWADYDIVGAFRELNVPIGFDTDVNGAMLGEVKLGAARGCENALYITVGTGIGVGVYANGKLVHGMLHPEGGHVLITRNVADTYKGTCPYHSNCLEGLACGPAIQGRFGRPAKELFDEAEVWELESEYLAQAITNYIMLLSPEKIILGGGVMHQTKLFPMIRDKVTKLLAGYLKADLLENMEQYIVPPALGDDAGIKGALVLAAEAVHC